MPTVNSAHATELLRDDEPAFYWFYASYGALWETSEMVG